MFVLFSHLFEYWYLYSVRYFPEWILSPPPRSQRPKSSFLHPYLIFWTPHYKAHSRCWVRKRTVSVFWHLELPDDVCEEEKHLCLSKSHPQALSPSNKKGDQAFILHKASWFIKKSLRVEFSWVGPVLRIIENVPEEGKDCGASRKVIIINLCCRDVLAFWQDRGSRRREL